MVPYLDTANEILFSLPRNTSRRTPVKYCLNKCSTRKIHPPGFRGPAVLGVGADPVAVFCVVQCSLRDLLLCGRVPDLLRTRKNGVLRVSRRVVLRMLASPRSVRRLHLPGYGHIGERRVRRNVGVWRNVVGRSVEVLRV